MDTEIIATAFWTYLTKEIEELWGYTGSQVLIIVDGLNIQRSYAAIRE